MIPLIEIFFTPQCLPCPFCSSECLRQLDSCTIEIGGREELGEGATRHNTKKEELDEEENKNEEAEEKEQRWRRGRTKGWMTRR